MHEDRESPDPLDGLILTANHGPDCMCPAPICREWLGFATSVTSPEVGQR